MRVLVVGGAGYIGSVVTRVLRLNNIEPVVFDNFSKGHRQAIPADCITVCGDMGNVADVEAALKHNVDAIMHFAAFIEVGQSVTDPAGYYQNNVVKTLNLLDCARARGIDKIIFSSTAAVYGEPNASPITESFPLQPTNPYGETKLAVEKILQWYSKAYSMRYVALRYFNAAGAFEDAGEDHSPESHLIPLVLQVAQGVRTSVTVYGDDYNTPDGTCIRDYIHVRDLADAHVRALLHLCDGGQSDAFNLGSGAGATVLAIINAVEAVTQRPVRTISGARRPGDPTVLVASNERIKRQLGWNPTHSSLKEIITDAWNWRLKHPQGYASSGQC